MSGTVNISRRIWSDTAFKPEPFTEREAFMWIIMEASYKPREKRIGNVVVDLTRGQLATSVRFMCVAWNWSKSRVDRFLKRLENRDMIGTESGTGINVITVCKYDEYQNTPNGSGTAKSGKRDSSGTAAGQQRDKPNKGLIPDEIPEAIQTQQTDTGVSLSVLPSVADKAFAEFWTHYPRRIGKAAASKAFAKAAKKHSTDDILFGLSQQIDTMKSKDQQFIPHAATWLNAERWTDEPEQHNDTNNLHGRGAGSQATQRPDASLERIARLAGVVQTSGDDRF
jgi:hypothetical protein